MYQKVKKIFYGKIYVKKISFEKIYVEKIYFRKDVCWEDFCREDFFPEDFCHKDLFLGGFFREDFFWKGFFREDLFWEKFVSRRFRYLLKRFWPLSRRFRYLLRRLWSLLRRFRLLWSYVKIIIYQAIMVNMYGKLARKMLTPFFSPHFKMKTRQNVTSLQYHVLYLTALNGFLSQILSSFEKFLHPLFNWLGCDSNSFYFIETMIISDISQGTTINIKMLKTLVKYGWCQKEFKISLHISTINQTSNNN